MTFNGTSAAYLVAFAIAAARAAFSSADSLGNANASITSVNAAVSSSTNASNSSLSCCAVTAQLLKYSSLSSQPRFPADRFATIPPNEAPIAPINAATEPPPRAGRSSLPIRNTRRTPRVTAFLRYRSGSSRPAQSRIPSQTNQLPSRASAFRESGSALYSHPAPVFPMAFHLRSLPSPALAHQTQPSLRAALISCSDSHCKRQENHERRLQLPLIFR